MKAFNIKQIMKQSKEGADNIANSKLCWELTNNSRNMLSQEIYHLVMKMVIKAQDNVVEQMMPKKKSVIIEKTGDMTWGMGKPQ